MFTKEEKELLLKDLCEKLPYEVKVNITSRESNNRIVYLTVDNICHLTNKWWSECKPYLFPLSSMTEEQYENFIIVSGWDGDIEDIRRGKFSCVGYIGIDYIYDTLDWLNKNHFDYRGLISMGLALDATGLGIY